MKWIIGLRNVKTGIAIFICLIVSTLLHLEYPFYAAIATIISMENSVTNSFKAGKHRTMGTFIGAIVGASFAFLEPRNAFYCAIGVMVVIYICNLLKWNKSVSIACIVFLAIMLNLKPGENPLSYGFHRITDTLIGIAVAVIVNYVVFPPRHEVSLHKARKALAKRMAEMFEQMAEQGEEPDLKGLRSQLSSLENYYQLCKYEFHLKKDLGGTMDQIGEEIESYRHIYEHFIILRRLIDEHRLKLSEADGGDESEAVGRTRTGQADTGMEAEAAPAIVYDYHVKWIYDEMQKLGLPVPLKERIRWAGGLAKVENGARLS
ncbi:aromatic acid exporter family protein [Paenibacillus oralis]|uniref:Aromatic acid exporter family protein n=1 Tax=Paenibacillus oralis TaxID=2490856 RepID=A0A3P3U8V4_9BACL|nr:aromatic acid exporter family protein [Paenibacillus oralis]RRJ66782.1 aromatic acid exporter family protein [Paenibacillus oralis]